MDATLDIGSIADGRVCLKGSLTLATVVRGLQGLRSLLSENQSLVIDLQHLHHADSSALALFFQLLDEAKQRQVVLSFANVPDFLLRIARLSNAEAILPVVSYA